MTSLRLIPGTVKNNARPRMVRALLATLFLIFAIGAVNSEAATANKTDNTKLDQRIMHSRAFETVIWSVPLMNYTAMRNGYKKGAGVDYNDVVYHSRIQTWELEIPTGNNTTPYVIAYWTVKDGPVVVESCSSRFLVLVLNWSCFSSFFIVVLEYLSQQTCAFTL
jgi:hypothetical protein